MDTLKTLHIFLAQALKSSAEQGSHNLMNRIETAMSRVGYTVDYHLDTPENRRASQWLKGYSLFHMQDPFHERSLNLRRAYFYPFWRIENTAVRWDFRVAQMPYPAEKQDPNMAKNFANNMRKWHFKYVDITRDGFVYIPLQGRISEHRSFQTCSPLEMIEKTLASEPDREIIASLHPSEVYTDSERDQIAALEKRHARFSLSEHGSDVLLPACDYVVSQNSSVAIKGYFLRKPSVIFGQIDFHHVAGNVGKIGLEAAFRHCQRTDINYDNYLFWFFRKTAINGGNEKAEDRILDAMQKGGWEFQ